jgi:3-methyladenine DNA glycosylase AlkD
MTTVTKVMSALKAKGSEQTRKIFARHGAGDNLFGVKVADMKVIAKTIKGEQDLAMELYDTGNYDAMYLAGMVADGTQMTKRQLQSWATKSGWQMIAEYTVPWVASESEHGPALATKWIDAKKEFVAAAGWNTWSALITTRPDDELDLDQAADLLTRIEEQLEGSPERVKYCMNGFVIAVGAYCKPLAKQAKSTAKRLGKVAVDMGGTACKVPLATEYIAKIEKMGKAGKKRKTIRC